MFRYYISLLLLLLFTFSTDAQQTADINNTVQLTADYSKADQTITLLWEQFANVTNFFVYEREIGTPSWGSAIATLTGTDTSYVINNVVPGTIKEYRVLRFASVGGAEGYATCGIEYQPKLMGRKMMLLVEQTIDEALTVEIDRYIEDVIAEGWSVTKIVIPATYDVAMVKEEIISNFNTDPSRYTTIFILGHVPVPYSGNINPDGHGNHVGAWACDGFYGDIDGNWTDQSVVNTTASRDANKNIIGDGKYDQSTYPSTLELAVGRVDMSNLPLFSDDEITLTKKYLDKNHAFRKGEIKSIHRGVIENNFSLAEGFGQNGFRNLTTLLGREQTTFGDYDQLKTETYLWSYGAGGGNYQGASGISNTTNFAQDSIQTIFTMLFGSYFGDWDSNNNFLRAALATGTTLSNVWAGRPHWHFHPMGMGATLSECALITQNNIGSYVTGFGSRQVHMALMGDPTLKMEYVQAPTDFSVVNNQSINNLSWTPSMDPDIDGYNVYRSIGPSQAIKLNNAPITVPFYADSCVINQDYGYYVSAVRLVEGFTGSYYNDSPFIGGTITVSDIQFPMANLEYQINNLEVTFANTSLNADNIYWDFGDGNFGNSQMETHTYSTPGDYTVTLTVTDAHGCFESIATAVITVDVSSTGDLLKDGLKLYPNPITDVFTIESNITGNIRLTDVNGRLIKEQNIVKGRNQISTDDIPKGLIIYSINLTSGSFNGMLVKE